MSSKDGSNDPQMQALFPMNAVDRDRMRKRLADNFCRIIALQAEMRDRDAPNKAEIERLKKANAAIVEELRGSPPSQDQP